MAVCDSHYNTLTYHCQHPSPPDCSLVWISSPSLGTLLTAVVSRFGQCTFLKKSSDIHGRLVINEDLYDTGSGRLIQSIYQFFEIPWGIPRTGWIHWGGGGGGGCPSSPA